MDSRLVITDLPFLVLVKILSYVSLRDRFRCQKVSRVFHDVCQYLWSIQTEIPEDQIYSIDYPKMILVSPKIRTFKQSNCGLDFIKKDSYVEFCYELSQKCQVIESYEGNFDGLMIYIKNLDDTSHLKSVEITGYNQKMFINRSIGDKGSNTGSDDIRIMREKLNDQLDVFIFSDVHMHNDFQNHLEDFRVILRNVRVFHGDYRLFSPGLNLRIMYELREYVDYHFADLFPKLELIKCLKFYFVNHNNLTAINRCKNLKIESAEFMFRKSGDEDMRQLFFEFIQNHPELQVLRIDDMLPVMNGIFRMIGIFCPDLRELRICDFYGSRQDSNEIFDCLISLKNVTCINLTHVRHQGFTVDQIRCLLNTLTKLQTIRYDPKDTPQTHDWIKSEIIRFNDEHSTERKIIFWTDALTFQS